LTQSGLLTQKGHATLISAEKAKAIPKCNTAPASHEKSSFSQGQIKLSAKSSGRRPGIQSR
jgi:hypothetical protein